MKDDLTPDSSVNPESSNQDALRGPRLRRSAPDDRLPPNFRTNSASVRRLGRHGNDPLPHL